MSGFMEKILIDFIISVYAHACIHAVTRVKSGGQRMTLKSVFFSNTMGSGPGGCQTRMASIFYPLSRLASPGWFSNSVPHRPHMLDPYM